jgi:hypothetical protein
MRRLFVLFAAIIVLQGGLSAGAVQSPTEKCWALSGVVMDPYGYPLVGAAVSVPVAKDCGNSSKPRVVGTNADGEFTVWARGDLVSVSAAVTAVAEGFVGETETMTASALLGGQSASAQSTGPAWSWYATNRPLDPTSTQPGEFVLQYAQADVTVSRWTTAGDTMTFAVRSVAPPPSDPNAPGVYALVDRPEAWGAGLTLTPGPADPAGWRTWTASWVVPPGIPDADEMVSLCLVDQAYGGTCAAVDAVTLVSKSVESVAAGVDSTPPTIWPGQTFPRDGGNTVHRSGLVATRITDVAGSGPDLAQVSISILDATDQVVEVLGGAALGFDPTAYWVTAAPSAPFQMGGRYRLRVTAADLAGNTTSYDQSPVAEGGGFVVTSVGYGATSAEIPDTACRLESSQTPGFKKAVCDNVPLSYSPADVTLDASLHPGDGIVGHRVKLDAAVVKTNINKLTTSLPAYKASDPAYAPRLGALEFRMGAASTPQTVTAAASPLDIGTLTVEVPATWTDATLTMPPTTTTVVPATCAAPTESCSPNPIEEDTQSASSWGEIEGTISSTGSVTAALTGEWATGDSILEYGPHTVEVRQGSSGEDAPLAGCEASPFPEEYWFWDNDIGEWDPMSAGEMFLWVGVWRKARTYPNEDRRDRYVFCSEGGATTTGTGAELNALGFSLSIESPVNRKPATPSWAVGKDQPRPSSSISAGVDFGVVTASATNQNTPSWSENTGHNAHVAPPWRSDSHSFEGDYISNGWWAWWEHRCGTNFFFFSDCHPSQSWQAANGEVFYDIPAGTGVAFKWTTHIDTVCDGYFVQPEGWSDRVGKCVPFSPYFY